MMAFDARIRDISCPCAKHGNYKLIPKTSNDWPRDLFMVIAKDRCTRNCSRLKSKGKSVESSVYEESKHPLLCILPWWSLPRWCYSLVFSVSLVILHSLGWLMLRNMMITELTFNSKLCDRNPGNSSEFENTVWLRYPGG